MTNNDLCGCGKDHKAEVAEFKGDMAEFMASIRAALAKEAEPVKELDYHFTDEQVETLKDDLYYGEVAGGPRALVRLIVALVPAVRAVTTIRELAKGGSTRSPAAEAEVLARIKRMDIEMSDVLEIALDAAKPITDYYFPEVSKVPS